jgi:RHS repeat-associated protein
LPEVIRLAGRGDSPRERLATVKQGTTTTRAFLYDAAGNMTRDTRGTTQHNYTISAAGRLARVAIGTSVRADYVYDGLSRLASRVTQNQVGAGTVRYVHDNENRIIAELNATGTTIREYIWLEDIPVAVLDGSTNTANPSLFFVHADHLNRPVAMSNAARSWVWRAQYEPFGAVHSIVGPAANDNRFPGQMFQLEAGLAYNWHRHYDASLGRYTQPDPLGAVHLMRGVSEWKAKVEPSQPRLDAQKLDLQMKSSAFKINIADERMGFSSPITKGGVSKDGPALFNYARQRPLQAKDPTGLLTPGMMTPMPKPNIQNCGLTKRCEKAKEKCIENCTNTTLPTGEWSGDPFFYCLARCMEAAGCR